jgi:hypothetical protein
MKNHMKSIISLATLAIALNASPAQLPQTGAEPGEPTPPKEPPPRPQRPARSVRSESTSSVQLDQAAEQLEAAQMAVAKADMAVGRSWAIAGGAASSASHSLVILKDGSDSKTIEECEEDLNVMARILDKTTSRRTEKGHNAMGIVVHAGVFGESSAPRNLYIDGYGALFFLNVNYPLVAPPAKRTEPEAKEDTNSEWEATRRELSQPSASGFSYNLVPQPSPFGSSPSEEYDAEKVEDLKEALTAALKNATHIRKLKSDETVTVVVTGRSGGPEPKVVTKKISSSTGGGGGGGVSGSGGSVYTDRLAGVIRKAPVPDSRGSKLILRAKKSDLEAVQKIELTPEEFRKKVSIQVY